MTIHTKLTDSSCVVHSTSSGADPGKKTLQHTVNHQDCPACIEANLLLVELDSDFTRRPFSEAAQTWMELRKRGNLKARTHEDNETYIVALGHFFESMRLCDITPGHVRA